MGAVICLAGGVYFLDGETAKGLAGVLGGVLLVVIAEYMVRRARR